MIKKILRIARKDGLIARRDAMLLYIIVIPLLLAVGILFFVPGLNDTTVKVSLLENDNSEHITFMETYAKVERFPNLEELERRVNKRDDSIGMVLMNGTYEIIVEGNELEEVKSYAQLLNVFYDKGLNKDNTTATLLSFEKTVPPLKTKLVNMLISMTIMLTGMIIALGIVEEKADNTISAINITPVSQTAFIIGKSLMGGTVALLSIIGSLLIVGYYDINWIMVILVGVSSMMLSVIIGFLQGLNSTDVMEAAGGVKMLMLPIAGSIAGYEFLADKWQWTMYWSPFYWAYKANEAILSKTADWGTVLLSVSIVLALSLGVYLISIPRIRKGLS
jgi:ABC-type Na+ efflux pump permease subunit